jgi:hypothetical protein
MRKAIAAGCLMALAATPAAAVVGGREGGPGAEASVMVLRAGGGVCTGIVLSRRAILTAGHCLGAGAELRIHWREGGEPALVQPAETALHPGFKAGAVASRQRSIDLALVRLAQPLPARFGTASLREGSPPRAGAHVTLAGYGVSREGEARTSGTYRSAALTSVEPYGPGKILIWVADPATGGKRAGAGACQGDSGGPILDDAGRVLAVTSWAEGSGRGQCGRMSQGVLVAPQRGWIDRTLSGWGETADWAVTP